MDDDKIKLLARNLLDHPCLLELDLSHNLIRDNGAQALGKLISHSRLETLNLCNNQIRHLGAQALAQGLAESSTLTSLNLRLNFVEDKGGEAIGHALLTNTSLKSLHLGSNNLSEPTAAVFSQVLAQSTTLTSINFSCNHLGLVREASSPSLCEPAWWPCKADAEPVSKPQRQMHPSLCILARITISSEQGRDSSRCQEGEGHLLCMNMHLPHLLHLALFIGLNLSLRLWAFGQRGVFPPGN